MSVIDCVRGLRRSAGAATGALGNATVENRRVSSATSVSAPLPSRRTRAALASAPWPRITEK